MKTVRKPTLLSVVSGAVEDKGSSLRAPVLGSPLHISSQQLSADVGRPAVEIGSLDLNGPGFLRLADVLRIVPVSRSTWYAGAGTTYPTPVPLGGGRAKGYRKCDVKALVERLMTGVDHV